MILAIALMSASVLDDYRSQIYYVDLYNRNTTLTSNLSPLLQATKDCNGTLFEINRKVAIRTSDPKSLLNSRTVKQATVIPNANGVLSKQLKISLKPNKNLTSQDLERLGLKLISFYEKGSFLIVEPVHGKIDYQLIVRLERADQIKFVTSNAGFSALGR